VKAAAPPLFLGAWNASARGGLATALAGLRRSPGPLTNAGRSGSRVGLIAEQGARAQVSWKAS
jgi:hypothetical protein